MITLGKSKVNCSWHVFTVCLGVLDYFSSHNLWYSYSPLFAVRECSPASHVLLVHADELANILYSSETQCCDFLLLFSFVAFLFPLIEMSTHDVTTRDAAIYFTQLATERQNHGTREMNWNERVGHWRGLRGPRNARGRQTERKLRRSKCQQLDASSTRNSRTRKRVVGVRNRTWRCHCTLQRRRYHHPRQ